MTINLCSIDMSMTYHVHALEAIKKGRLDPSSFV